MSEKATVKRILVLLVLTVLAIVACWTPMQSGSWPGFAIRPYITWLSETEATLNWRLKSSGSSRIEYGRTFDYEVGELITPGGVQHQAVLSGLSADTTYHYRVDNAFLGSFRTDKGDGKYSFSVIGHTHGTEQFGHYPDRVLASRLVELGVDFGIHCGDTTFFGTPASFGEYYFDVFARFLARTPMYVAPGNHDAGWPFLNGVNLDPFKELFTFPYPESISENSAEAFYAVDKGGLKLLFLSYTSDLSEGSLQRNWLREQLKSSQSDFNVIVYGGANAYFDEKSLLKFLSHFRVDAILNGDGSASAQPWRREYGIPIYFTGTGGDRPHPLLYCEYKPEYLTLKKMDASGVSGTVDWIHRKKVLDQKMGLVPMEFGVHEGRLHVLLGFVQPLISDDVEGIQIRLTLHTEGTRSIYAYLNPMDFKEGELGYRTQAFRIGPQDQMITLPFTQRRPHTGEPFEIQAIGVIVEGISDLAEISFPSAYLY